MNPKIAKINAEYEKNRSKIAEIQARQRELDKARTKLENNDILELVHSYKLDIDGLAVLRPRLAQKSRRILILKMRKLISLMLVLVCTLAFNTTAYAGGDDPDPTEIIQPKPESTIELEPLTPEGNMSLVDDIDGEDKQFITVTTKNDNYFYIIIDRAADGENTVHFLNQVDERDLLALNVLPVL